MDYFVHNRFATHYKAATFFLDNAKLSEEGRFYNLLSCILFCALTLEAYLNHIGQVELGEEWDNWDSRERPNIKIKLKKLSEICDLILELNSKPFSIIHPLFQFRDLVVHGKTETIRKNTKNPQNNSNGALKNLSPRIEKFCTIANAEEVSNDIQNIIETLNKNSKNKVSQSQLWNLGHGSFRVNCT